MKRSYWGGAFVAIVVILGLALWYRARVSEFEVNKAPAGYELITKMEKEGVPDFELNRVKGGELLTLSSLKGKVVVVNFWASWCNPCVEEFPSMIKMAEEMKGDVIVVAVATDDEIKDVEAFLKAFGLPRPNVEVVWDKEKSVMKKYGIDKIPESFIANRDHKLVRKVLGSESWGTPEAIAYFRSIYESGGRAKPAQ